MSFLTKYSDVSFLKYLSLGNRMFTLIKVQDVRTESIILFLFFEVQNKICPTVSGSTHICCYTFLCKDTDLTEDTY